MRILLDERPCDLEATCLGEAIAGASELAEQRGRIIVDVFVNGDRCTDSQLDTNELLTTSPDEVQLVSANLEDLVRATLDDASSILLAADEHQRSAAELLQQGDRVEAMSRLGEAISIWISVSEAIAKTSQAMLLDLDDVRVGDTTVRQSIDLLHAHLERVRAELTADDTVALSDTLLYDLPEVVTDWREIIAELRERAGSTS